MAAELFNLIYFFILLIILVVWVSYYFARFHYKLPINKYHMRSQSLYPKHVPGHRNGQMKRPCNEREREVMIRTV